LKSGFISATFVKGVCFTFFLSFFETSITSFCLLDSKLLVLLKKETDIPVALGFSSKPKATIVTLKLLPKDSSILLPQITSV